MTWTPRQRAMLAEMGIPLWFPAAEAPEVDAPDSRDAPAPAPRPAAPVPVSVRPAAPPAPRAAPLQAPATAPAVAPALPVHLYRPPVESSALHALDWPALREAVAACTACGLSGTRQHTVFGTGHPRAHWMIVGEAPGAEEDRLGEPFVGTSGELLDNMLRAIGLSRQEGAPDKQVYIANTVKCRPPGNRNPASEELQKCEPFLNRQIALVQPRLILAMGRFAVQSLLRSDEPIGRLRGRVHQYQGVPLIVTYHPAYLLRQPVDKAKAWDDLCLAALTMAELGP